MYEISPIFSLEVIAALLGGVTILNPGELLSPLIRLILFILLFSVVIIYGWYRTSKEKRNFSEITLWSFIYVFFSAITIYSYSVKETKLQNDLKIKKENYEKIEHIKQEGSKVLLNFFNSNENPDDVIASSVKWRNDSKITLVKIRYDLYLQFEMALPEPTRIVSYAQLNPKVVNDYNLIVAKELEVAKMEKEFE